MYSDRFDPPNVGHTEALSRLEPDELIALVGELVGLAEPLIGHFAKLCAEIAKQRRLEIEAKLVCRLQELAQYFDKLDELRAKEVEERDVQYQALVVLLEIAKASHDPALILQGMRCFQEYVKSSPSLTRDFVDAVKAFDQTIK